MQVSALTGVRAAGQHDGQRLVTHLRYMSYAKGTGMTSQTPAQQMIGDFAPKLAELTDDVLFGDVWARPELSPRDRSLVTCAALVTNGSTEQLRHHLGRARQNGLSQTELKEMIIHLAFYAGWPRAMSAITLARELFSGGGDQ
jgi:4-carboxymuconolactone decarboxylase